MSRRVEAVRRLPGAIRRLGAATVRLAVEVVSALLVIGLVCGLIGLGVAVVVWAFRFGWRLIL